MSQQRQMTREAWDAHKEHIHRYYIQENCSLKTTMKLMRTHHNFEETQGKYVRQLQNWQLATPSLEPSKRVSISTIPWFQLQVTFSSHLLSVIHHAIPSLTLANSSNSLLTYNSSGELSMRKANYLLGDIPHFSEGKIDNKLAPKILECLEAVLPQKSNKDCLVSKEPFFLLVQSCIYLSSNNNLSLNHMDKFLAWIFDCGGIPFFSMLISQLRRIRSPTSEIFLNRLLLSAISEENEVVVSILLQSGLDPNHNNHPHREVLDESWRRIQVDYSFTPLQLASLRGNFAICKLLLRHGAKPDALSRQVSFSPLELAVSIHHGNFQIAEMLVAEGSDIELSNSYEIYKSHYSHPHGPEILQLKLTHKTLLMKAVTVQNIEITRMFLHRQAPPDAVSYVSGTAMQIATTKNDRAIVELLLQSGAKVNIFDMLEDSAAKYFTCHLEKYHKGLQHMYDSDTYEERNDFQIDKGDDFDKNVEWGAFLSPVQIATQQDNLHLVRRLLQAGATLDYILDLDKLWKQISRPMSRQVHHDGNDDDKEEDFNMYYRDEWYYLENHIRDVSEERLHPILHDSVKNGNIALTRLLLESGAVVDARNSRRLTPLHIVCVPPDPISKGRDQKLTPDLAQRKKLIQLLIEYCADVNSQNGWGRTILQEAVQERDQEVVELLINNGAEIQSAMEDAAKTGNLSLLLCCVNNGAVLSEEMGWLVLHAAALNGDLPATEWILKQGVVNVNALPLENYTYHKTGTILHAATKSGNIEVVRMLLNAGADINQVAQGETALCAAVRGDRSHIFDLLLAHGADPNLATIGTVPLAIAAWMGFVEMTRSLLQAGCDVDQLSDRPDEHCWTSKRLATPLVWALDQYRHKSRNHKKDTELLQHLEEIPLLLLSYGADPSAGSEIGTSVLSIACESKSHSIVDKAIKCGANINTPGEKGHYPIHVAANNGSIEIVQLLLSAGADVNAPPAPKDGHSTFYYAFQHGQEMVRLTINSGAIMENKGELLVWALSVGYIDLAFDLIEDGADVNCLSDKHPRCYDYPWGVILRPLILAAFRGRADLVQLLLDRGADINAVSGYTHRTALQVAAARGHFDVVKLLVERGASMAASTDFEVPALYSAVANGHFKIAKKLIENGADTNINTNGQEITLLQLAAKESKLEFIDLLVKNGADVNAPAGYGGGTALQYAVANGDFNTVKLFLEKGVDIHAAAPQQDKDEPFDGYKPDTALRNAAKYGRLDITSLLLENDNEVDVIASRCKEAAMVADNKGHHVLARMLRNHRPRGHEKL